MDRDVRQLDLLVRAGIDARHLIRPVKVDPDALRCCER